MHAWLSSVYENRIDRNKKLVQVIAGGFRNDHSPLESKRDAKLERLIILPGRLH